MLLCSNMEERKRRELGEMVCELGKAKFGWLARVGGGGGEGEKGEGENVFVLLVRMLLNRRWNRVLFCLPEDPTNDSSLLPSLPSSSISSSISSSYSSFSSSFSAPLSIPYASWSRSPFTPLVECCISSELLDFLKKYEGLFFLLIFIFFKFTFSDLLFPPSLSPSSQNSLNLPNKRIRWNAYI